MPDIIEDFEDIDLSKKDWYYLDRKINPVVVGRGILNKYHALHNFCVTKDNKEIWMYNGNGFYEPIGSDFIDDRIQYHLQTDYNTYIRNTVIDWVTKIADLQIDRNVFNANINLVNLRNGIYNLETKEFMEHNPKYYLSNQIPVIYNPDANINRIQQFLEEILYKDDIPIIQELVGYLLTKKYTIHKAFMFSGEGSNGKSTLINLLKAFIGEANSTSISLQDLTYQRFSRAYLFNKLANFFPDLPDIAIKDTGIFKALTGQDTITADVKFSKSIQFQNYAKLVFSTNKIPRAYDDSDAFYRRWILISFPNRFEGDNCNTKIIEEISTDEELSGLFNWGIKGLHRLLENGRFSYSKSTELIRQEYERKSNPTKAFIEDKLSICEDGEETKEDVYSTYVDYCKDNKFPIKASNVFARELREFPEMRNVKAGQRLSDGKRLWRGVRILR